MVAYGRPPMQGNQPNRVPAKQVVQQVAQKVPVNYAHPYVEQYTPDSPENYQSWSNPSPVPAPMQAWGAKQPPIYTQSVSSRVVAVSYTHLTLPTKA